MATQAVHDANVFRIRGSLTITRAASIQREIDAQPDPLIIDLSGVERMDTVGAWLVYRTVRDRGAKVVGASPAVELSGAEGAARYRSMLA